MYWKYAVRRILNGILSFVIIIFILSALFNTVMEETARTQIEEMVRGEIMGMQQARQMSAEEVQTYYRERIEFFSKQYMLDRPVFERIIFRTWNTLTFQFGRSTSIRSSGGSRDVFTIVWEVVPRTVSLFTVAMAVNILIGLWLGIRKARKPGKTLDKSTSIVTMVVFGMPAWWLGMMLIMFFSYTLRLFPSGGMVSSPPPSGIHYFFDMLYHMVLPLMTLVLIGFWGSAFLTRNIVLSILQEDFIMSARARGLPERKVMYGHTLRTAAPPVVTMALLSLLATVAGSIIFEGIFSWPGLGNLYWVAVGQNDIPVLMGNLALTVGLYISGLVILDLIYGFLDPRIKVGGRR